MVVFLLVVAGVLLLCVAGCNVQSRRFAPQWWGLACLSAAFFADVLTRVGGS